MTPPADGLRSAGTVLATVVLFFALGFFLYIEHTTPKTAHVDEPERALSLMVGRTLDLDESLAALPAWERFLYEGTASTGLSELDQAILWYEELHQTSTDPRVAFELAVLCGEAGRIDAVREFVNGWISEPPPHGLYAELLNAAYLSGPSDEAAEKWEAEIDALLPAGWFPDRLALRLAERAGANRIAVERHARLAARGHMLLGRTRDLTIVEFMVLAAGLPAVIVTIRRRRDQLVVGGAVLPPPWSGWTGMAVFVRGSAAGIVLTLMFIFIGDDSLALRLIVVPVTALPLLLLARIHLLQPAGRGIITGFGLRPLPGAAPHLFLTVVAVLGAGMLIEWILGTFAEWRQLTSHWTEWFDADLAWGDGGRVIVTMIEYVIIAPVFEEIAFRGLLYGTLRRRWAMTPAALMSAALFAVVHGYGVVGFASVVTSGLLWAWIYEKTGSLLPGMLAHALNNLFVCATVMWLLR